MVEIRRGGCQCGHIRYELSDAPLGLAVCHCKACQRRTGALAGSGAAFAKAQVRIEGPRKVFERDGQAGRKVRFHFCPDCGTSLYWDADVRPDLYIVAVGAFADPDFPPPSVSVFEESKHSWTQLPDGMTHFQGTVASRN